MVFLLAQGSSVSKGRKKMPWNGSDVTLSRTNDTTVTGEAFVDLQSRRFVTTGGCLWEDSGRLQDIPVVKASQPQSFRTELTASRSALRNRLKH